MQPPWERFLDEVVEAGFEWIELGPYEYLPADSFQLRTELERRGLKVCSGFAMKDLADPSVWPELERQVLEICEILADLAARGRSTFSELRWYPPMEAAKGSLSWVFRAKQPESVRTGP